MDGRADGGPRPRDGRPGRADPPATAAERTTVRTGADGPAATGGGRRDGGRREGAGTDGWRRGAAVAAADLERRGVRGTREERRCREE